MLILPMLLINHGNESPTQKYANYMYMHVPKTTIQCYDYEDN